MANRWLRRKRNSLGYGVQSPGDFYFVQHVLRETSPYYAYAALHRMMRQISLPDRCDEVYRLLFRLANHVHPDVMIAVGSGPSAIAMAMACPQARCVAIERAEKRHDALHSLLAEYPHVELKNGDEMALFRQVLPEVGTIQLLHVAHTAYYREVVEAALPYVTPHTLFVIDDIRADKEKQAWWKSLRESRATGVSYDLGSMGLLFFDHSRYKETYWINLRR